MTDTKREPVDQQTREPMDQETREAFQDLANAFGPLLEAFEKKIAADEAVKPPSK